MATSSRILVAVLCGFAVVPPLACGDALPAAPTPVVVAAPKAVSPTAIPMPTATATPTPGSVPTVTPTAAPIASTAPSPTASPTPTAEPTPTPDPTSLSYITWSVGDGVSPEVEGNVRLGFRLMHDYAASLGLPAIEGPVNVYVYRDLEKLIDAHREVTGEPRDEVRKWAAKRSGYVLGTDVFINAGVLGNSPADEQAYVSAHELNHVQNNYLTRTHRAGRPGRVSYSEPVWFSEGIATYMGWQAVSAGGSTMYEARRRLAREALESTDLAGLEDLETRSDFRLHEGVGFDYSMLAAELLAVQSGQRSLIEFYTTLEPGVSWAEQFESVFGMGTSEFHGRFEAYEDAGFPLPKAVFDPVELSERAALVALYRATDGPEWAESWGWLSDAPIGNWHGVTTDAGGRVTRLEPGSNWLIGPLPGELAVLSELRMVDFGGNRLAGPIPGWLGSLLKLEHLDLGDNRLNGPIPAELGRLSGLKVLDLGENELSGPIPDELGGLRELTVLDLGSNRLEGPIPSWLAGLSELRELDLSVNQLSGWIPAGLDLLPNLTDMYFIGNPLTGCIPLGLRDVKRNDLSGLGLSFGQKVVGRSPDRDVLIALYEATGGTGWTNDRNWLSDAQLCEWYGVETDSGGRVTRLDLDDNRLVGVIPTALGDLVELRELDLNDNRLSGSIPAELGNLRNLRALILSFNSLGGSIPAELGSLINLRELHLVRNSLSGPIPAELGGLANLREMILRDNSLSGPIPAELGGLANLREMVLAYNRLSGPIPAELSRLSNLRQLILSYNLMDGQLPGELGGLSELRIFYGRNNLFTGPIPAELGRLSNLTELSLRYNQLSGEIPVELGRLDNLEVLLLEDNRLTGSIPAELGNLTNLWFLHLSGNDLSGCIPAGLREVEDNDLYYLGLTDCT